MTSPQNTEQLDLTIARCIEAGDLPQAAQALNALLQHQPDAHAHRYQLGSVYFHLNKIEQALQMYEMACLQSPLESSYHLALGLSAFHLRRFDVALAAFFRTSVLAPANADATLNMGACYFELEQYEAAQRCFEQAVQQLPEPLQALKNLGICLGKLHRHEAALQLYDDLLKRYSEDAQAWASRGIVLHRLGRFSEAVSSYQKALQLDPNLPSAHLNWGITAMEQGVMAVSEKHLRTALALQPESVDVRWNLSLALLLQGAYEEGFKLYETRRESLKHRLFRVSPGSQAPHLSSLEECRPVQEPVRVYVYDEQGLGDTIHFARYLTLLKGSGATLLMRAERGLRPLIASMNLVDIWVGDMEEPPAHDFQTSIMSLARVCDTRWNTVPCAQGYLQPDPGRVAYWKDRLAEQCRYTPETRVRGLMWSGNPMNPNDAKRSVPLNALLAHLPENGEGVVYVALSNALSFDDEALLREDGRVLNLARQIRDFADTAAVLSLCEVVVAVDTSVAHLAGALGVPTRLLLPYSPDWRWGLGQNTTPWYDSLRLHRQLRAGEWGEILHKALGCSVDDFA